MSQDQFQWASCETNLSDRIALNTAQKEALNPKAKQKKMGGLQTRKSPPLLVSKSLVFPACNKILHECRKVWTFKF